MLDPQNIRQNIDAVAEQLLRRDYIIDKNRISALEKERKELQIQQQDLQSQRNRASKEIGIQKKLANDSIELVDSMKELGLKLSKIQKDLVSVQNELNNILESMPNIPHGSVPMGKSEQDNEELDKWGHPRQFNFQPIDHVELGAKLNMMDFDRASAMSGSRFVTLAGPLAGLHRALIQFMLDLHIREHGYLEAYVPFLVNADSLFGTGQLPKFLDDQFCTDSDPQYFLIPTAEVPVTNLYRDQIITDDMFPIKRVCHTPCFRREAGSYGKDTRGMIRQHQFEKVELVHIVRPLESWETLETLTNHAEIVLQKLELPYRKVVLCTGDLGFASSKTYDLEVWLPGQQAYREISSCSNFQAFQARRMRTRWRNPDTGKTEFVHTLNGSGIAVGRALVAIMENNQNEDGSVNVPSILRQYMGGLDRIT
ncbi:MAG: serine--tRNA ligase [Acidiferrobacteraceae bacterium]|nr:serine--tRNA ligase [Acidiferrobacteraceae bacterium]|tara:strand:- start:74 stop:1348 length:1275 start_codon:yes stop_codon:yes gene_type:complete